MADISLTASMRSNLLSLQNTQSLMDTTQERLSTGKKVNSAIDNPSSYYTAQSLTNRASDLNALLDSMGQGIQTIKAANEGIEAITAFVQQAKAIANTARDESPKSDPIEGAGTFATNTGGSTFQVNYNGETKTVTVAEAAAIGDLAANINAGLTAAGIADITVTGTGAADDPFQFERAAASGSTMTIDATIAGISFKGEQGSTARLSAEKRYNDILNQIDQLAKDAGYKGVNLLQENDLKVVFNEDRSSFLNIKGVNADSTGLGLAAVSEWSNSNNTAIDTAITDVENAINKLRNMASEFGNNYSTVQNRENFTSSLVNVLEEGADKLTLADMNEESANMLALQTRQQLAINSLSLASQSAQSVLKLFG